MPDGVVQWFDPATGEGRVLRGGRRFSVHAEHMEPAARVPGARVHFDIKRSAGDAAVNVTLRRGTRVSPRQRRFGDLVGARAPDTRGTAPFAAEHTELGRDLQRHPMEVARRWSALMTAGDLDSALLLYAPDATLRTGGDVLAGPGRIRSALAASPLLGGASSPTIKGDGETITLQWSAQDLGDRPVASRMRVAHGEIAEQWLGEAVVTEPAEPGAPPITVSSNGEVGEVDRAYAVEKIGQVLHTVEGNLLHTIIRLQLAPDPARDRPALARVTLDVDGEPVRAHVAAHSLPEAIDLLERRLRRRLEDLAAHRRALRRRGPTSPPGEWRHGDLPAGRPGYFPRPVDEREIARRKTYTTTQATIDEAIFDLEALDHAFFLFTDLGTNADAVVHHLPGGSYRLRYVHGRDEAVPLPPTAAVIEIDPRAAPELSLREARERLDTSDEPWVFFEDATSHRGHILYRRYDGHYGLVTPVDEPDGEDLEDLSVLGPDLT